MRATSGAVAGLTAPALWVGRANARIADHPFRLGVASGSPGPTGMVLWTRLAPRPLLPGAGMTPEPVDVRWEVAVDPALTRIVRSGTARAEAAWAHSLHVEVDGLEPARWYWYRFSVDGWASPTGRTRTLPPVGRPLDRWRMVVACCQDWEDGYFAGHRHIAAEDADLVLFLGDYIYEGEPLGRPSKKKYAMVRRYDHEPPRTLDEYRAHYELYKVDSDLQACHAALPWVSTTDDHEVENDYSNNISPTHRSPELMLPRRAAAYQAYWEHMPLPLSARPRGPDMDLHHAFDIGDLMRIYVLDERQYRHHLACPAPGKAGSRNIDPHDCEGMDDPQRSMLGWPQERWLDEAIGGSRARWNVLAQQTLVAPLDRQPGPKELIKTDSWEGFPAARERLIARLARPDAANPVLFGGDMHAFFAAALHRQPDNVSSAMVASEFVASSLSTGGRDPREFATWVVDNPHLLYASTDYRGYIVVDLAPDVMRVTYRALENAADPKSGTRDLARFAVESGRPWILPG